MTIEKARSILKGYAKNLTDEEIQSIVDTFNAIIEVGFKQFERKHGIEVSISKSNEKKNLSI